MSTATEFVDSIPTHLAKRKGTAISSQFSEAELGEREYWCRDCKARVTRASDDRGEYGHVPTCKHSIRRRDDHSLQWRGTEEDNTDE